MARMAKCINNDNYSVSLKLGKSYKIIDDEAEQHEWIRIIDETNEDYLYPAQFFEITGNK